MVDVIAAHEVGHAVMRWLRGWPAGELVVTESGGYNGRPGKKRLLKNATYFQDEMYVALAGHATKVGYGVLDPVDVRPLYKTKDIPRDFVRARDMALALLGKECGGDDLYRKLQREFDYTCQQLLPHACFIEGMAMRLARDGRMSARSVAAQLREYQRRLDKGDWA